MIELLKQALVEQLGIDASLIKPESYVKKDLELDSTETVIIALEIKKNFNVDFKFPADDISLQQIVDQVQENINQKN